MGRHLATDWKPRSTKRAERRSERLPRRTAYALTLALAAAMWALIIVAALGWRWAMH